MKRRAARRPVRRVDPAEPQPVRVDAREGLTAVMRAEWRDPTDITPSAVRAARTISGYRSFCPLRRMQRQNGSQITNRHICAADRLRGAVDIARIGLTGLRDWLPVTAVTYRPRAGPSHNAEKQARAARDVCRIFRKLTRQQREMAVEILLRNKSLARWCQDCGAGNDQVAMGRLLSLLDALEEFYSSEIDRDIAHDVASL